MDPIVVFTMLQDAAPGILEWLAFHRLVGVDRFVLYDLGNSGATAALIARSRFSHQATVIDWADRDGPVAAYADFVTNHARRFTWAAVIEIGEFVHPLESDTIRAILPRYNEFSAVLLRRLTFATLGQQPRPGQLVLGSYTNRLPDMASPDGTLPMLLRTAALMGMGGVPDSAVCNARAQPVQAEDLAAQVCDDVMVVNYYPTPSGSGPATDGVVAPMVPDRRILHFIPRVRAMLHDASLAAQPQPRSAPQPAPPTPSQVIAALHLGIGVITYNRQQILSRTLDRVQQHTKHARTVVAVADDGSSDGTLEMLRTRRVLTVTGRNMSIAWNKNRALFLLFELMRCDVVVLLEDDAYPSQDNWEDDWMRVALRWGHANIAGQWLAEHFVSGAGTPDDPILSKQVTAQCSVFSREAVLFGGYFDSRFRGYGHEHVEHSRRLTRLGYGGVDQDDTLFTLIRGGLSYHNAPPTFDTNAEQVEQNRRLAHELFADFSYRAPWRDEAEAKQFREEMRHSFPRTAL